MKKAWDNTIDFFAYTISSFFTDPKKLSYLLIILGISADFSQTKWLQTSILDNVMGSSYASFTSFMIYFFWFWAIGYIIFNRYNIVSSEKKIVFVIDELDKLLYYEKNKDAKYKLSIKQVFDVLIKLKTLFFDNTWALFFVVTNKDAYNYYIQNNYQEDDIVSNIFNNIVYLPMIPKSEFNLNYSLGVEMKDKKLSYEYKTKFNDYLYFKSHWNWRKASFFLNQQIQNWEIIIDKKELDFEMKYYKFFNLIYNLFNENIFEDTSKEWLFYVQFVGTKHVTIGDFVNNWKIFEKHDFYLQYIYRNIKEQLSENEYEDKRKKFDDIISNNLSNSEKYFEYIIESIEKMQNEPAYKDFILNTLLNIFENIRHLRSTDIAVLFKNIKLSYDDINYPAFEDLIFIWLPFMIYYFTTYHIQND